MYAPIFDDLPVISPRVAEVEAAARKEFATGFFDRFPHSRPVVHDEADVAMFVGALRPSFGDGEELIARVYEGHLRRASSKLELENLSEEGEGFLDVVHFDGYVVEADEARHEAILSPPPSPRLRL